MTFVSNHDKNAWEGTEFEQFGAGLEAAIVLSVSDQARDVTLHGELHHGTYVDYFARTMVSFTPDSSLRLPAWGYRVFVRSGRLPG